jgi:hypothetical protein
VVSALEESPELRARLEEQTRACMSSVAVPAEDDGDLMSEFEDEGESGS